MKLIPLMIFTLSTAVNVRPNEHFTFPPQFHPHNSGVMSPDRTVYLPPESHTALPYYPLHNMKNVNLPFPYLPSTATKAPGYFSTPFPMMMSSTLLSIENDDDNEEDDKPSLPTQNNNRTQRSPPPKVEKRELRPKQTNYQPIDRIDMKVPFGFTANTNHGNSPVQNATPRSMIISPPDTKRNDYAMDQFKAAGFQSPQFIAAPNIPGVYLSSTTETAVPIIRLSNEMDLDGSFSYEALGADQTHYVQHSRMDNMGSEKQEQVVEGSYSYVGDNGQTYTVNYIADSNGFRASGDHLPVAPPIPEIIQRSIQYNLAEEAKKPPHMKSWNNEENESSESEKNQRYAISPPRNLFTGKTPESFSFAFSQGSQNTQNNLVPAASNQTPIKANVDFTQEQMKGKINNGISPQITFLASQGAHVPSVNPQQTIGRVFTTERSNLPQLINYEAGLKESEENNKALWRWQYGLNANINQTPEKNSISRSFGEGDDVMINFNDMTPQQYTSMIHSQLNANNEPPQNQQTQTSETLRNVHHQQNYHENQNNIFTDAKPATSSTESYDFPSQGMDLYQNNKHYEPSPKTNLNYKEINNQNYANQQYEKVPNVNQYQNGNSNENAHYVPDTRSKLITQDNFIPPSQIVTHSYNYEEMVYEPQKIRPSTMEPLTQSAYSVFDSEYKQMSSNKAEQQNVLKSNTEQIQDELKTTTTEATTTTTAGRDLKLTDYMTNENNNDFRPVYKPQTENIQEEATTTETDENIFRDNIFLRNLFKTDKIEPTVASKIKEEKKVFTQPKINPERKLEKSPKSIATNSKPFNEIQTMKKTPLDMADVMNFISLKNHFESAKTKPKYGSAHKQRNEMRFIPVQEDHYGNDAEEIEYSSSDLRPSYYQPELRGIIKNYKVLQRNNSAFTQESEQLSRDLSPPPVKISSNMPPLGRAGPSMKSYLPPIYI